MSAEALFCVPISSAQRDALREEVFAHRVAALSYLLTALRHPEKAARLGSHWQQIQMFVAELERLLDEEPARFRRLVDHWAAVFLLSRLEAASADRGEQVERLAGNLNSLLIAERLTREPQRPGIRCTARTDAQGRIYDFLRQGWLSLAEASLPDQIVHFELADDQAAVTAGNGGGALRFKLPINGEGPVGFVPFTHLSGWGLPLIEDSFTLGVEPKRRSLPPEESWRPPALAAGLETAYETLGRLWPEVLDWVNAIVPAFVDMGDPPNRNSQRSESYGPGSPIFLSAAETVQQLAESIVHELQHERLLLFAGSDLFSIWDDQTERFISPWRPDVRPVRGLYLAIHAFLAVNELRLRALRGERTAPRTALQILQTHCMNLFTLRTLLDHDRLSPRGERILAAWADRLSRHHETVRALAAPEDQQWVERFFDRHIEIVAAHGRELANLAPRYRQWDEIARDVAAFADRAGR